MALVERLFTQDNADPYAGVVWKLHNVSINDKHGKSVFKQDAVEFPDFWSDSAVQVVSSKYFAGAPDSRESSLKELITRVVLKISSEGMQAGYFDSIGEQETFQAELSYLILNQAVTFNSPVWFSIGREDRPQRASACYIVAVEDSMPGILEWFRLEGMIFTGGSGSGVNISSLRGKGEPLSKGGSSSGSLSFARAADISSGAIKSGGTTRRSAKMLIMNPDHPDIMEFIQCKALEEAKASVLIHAGYDSSFEGEVAQSLFFQNSNNSVRASDEFMQAVESDNKWQTREVVSGKVRDEYSAREMLHEIAKAAWISGCPGMQFDETIHRYHTCKEDGRQSASNPCQPSTALVLTPQGIRTFGDLRRGDIIWSGKQWTRVTRKVSTGVKSVYRFYTRAGYFEGTRDHRIFQYGERCQVGKADVIDTARGPVAEELPDFDVQTVVDGLMLGDGSMVYANGGTLLYPILTIGKKDHSYFESECSEYINRIAYDRLRHRVKTTLTAEELPHTYARIIPDRFFYGSANTVRSFLRGLYSANGSVLKAGRITLKAASFEVISQVQQMLSSLGIRSYYTINKEQDVVFPNGVYTSKQSYDLNVTVDRHVFRDLIGFIHPYKQRRLNWICEKISLRGDAKSSYEITQTEYMGKFPVYDITVESEDHSYWNGGLLVSNCSEYLFLNWTSCNLATINLMKFQTDEKGFDKLKFQQAVKVLTMAQDILLGFAESPTEKIATETRKYRTIGINYANLGAYLMSEGIPYDSVRARDFASYVTSLMTAYAYQASAHLAKHLGPFERFEANKEHVLDVLRLHRAHALERAPETQRDWDLAIADTSLWGVRNAQTTLAAPTGTVSFMLGADTTGVEPAIALVAEKSLAGGGSMRLVSGQVSQALRSRGYTASESQLRTTLLEEAGVNAFLDSLTESDWAVFDCALPHGRDHRFIEPEAHIRMVAAIQPFLSGGVSKTINVPNETTVEDIADLYMLAWRQGLKSVAIYRDGSKQAQPLTTQRPPQALSRPQEPFRRKLPDERPAITHKFSIAGLEGYITVGLYQDGSPGEVFLSVSKQGTTLSGLTDGFATLLSLALQYGVPLEDLVRKFSYMRFEPMGYTTNPDLRVSTSLIDYLFRWLESKFLSKSVSEHPQSLDVALLTTDRKVYDSPMCQECGGATIRSGVCYTCTVCFQTTGCS